ncbi:hypothetical protein ACWFNE_12335 [Cellulomonas sp. NPDC055163]
MPGGPDDGADVITLGLDGSTVPLNRSVFTALFESSVVHSRAPYLHALQYSTIRFTDFVDLARKAQIPYSLFFAPPELVQAQLDDKTEKLLSGVSKDSFSLNSRSTVQLRDVELIIKDILRKQGVIKDLDSSLRRNTLVGSLRRSTGSVAKDAENLRSLLDFAVTELRAAKTKEKALEYLIARLEVNQVFVSRSQNGFMPQTLPRGVAFSGLCVKDKKVPFIFLTSGEPGSNAEPAGRKIFTLVLLTVFVAVGRFAPVSYDDQTGELVTGREYELAEEVLMPSTDIRQLDATSLDAVKMSANELKVTPSAFVMRARRLGLVDADGARGYLDALAAEFAGRKKSQARTSRPENAVRKYAGAEFTRRMLRQLDRGAISPREFCRVVCLNRLGPTEIPLLQASL